MLYITNVFKFSWYNNEVRRSYWVTNSTKEIPGTNIDKPDRGKIGKFVENYILLVRTSQRQNKFNLEINESMTIL